MSLRIDPHAIGDHLVGREFAYVLTLADGRPHAVAQRVTADGPVVTVVNGGESLARRLEKHAAVTLLWPPSSTQNGEHSHYSIVADGVGRPDDPVTITVTSAVLHRPAP